MTNKEIFEEILALANENNKEEVANYAKHQLELIAKKDLKKTEKQREKEEIKVKIIEFLSSNGESKKASEIAGFLEISTQKTVPMLRELITENKVKKLEENSRVSYYNIVKK